jgi:multidrug efflux pump subunit AcrB
MAMRRPGIVGLLVAALLCCSCSAGVSALTGRAGSAPGPVLEVAVAWPGAKATEVESQLVLPIEGSLLGVQDLTRIVSESREGSARLSLTFEPGADPWGATRLVSDALDRITAHLPPDADAPTLQVGRRNVVATLVVSSDSRDEMEQRASALRDRLLRTPGVAAIDPIGAWEHRIEVQFDGPRLLAHRLTPEQAAEALAVAPEATGGSISHEGTTLRVEGRATGTTATIEVLAATVLHVGPDGRPLRVTDVASISTRATNPTGLARLAGAEAIALEVLAAHDVDEAALLATCREAARGQAALLLASPEVIALGAPLDAERSVRLLAVGADAAKSADPTAVVLVIVRPEPIGGGELRIAGGSSSAVEAAMRALLMIPGAPAIRPLDPRRRQIMLAGPDRWALDVAAGDLERQLETHPSIAHAGVSLSQLPEPDIRIELDRDTAARFGVTSAELSSALRLLAGQEVPGRPNVSVRVEGLGALDDPTSIQLVTPGPEGAPTLLPLATLATIERTVAPSSLLRVDGLPSLMLDVTPEDGASGEQVEAAVLAVLADLALPAGVSASLFRAP